MRLGFSLVENLASASLEKGCNLELLESLFKHDEAEALAREGAPILEEFLLRDLLNSLGH